MIYILYLIKKDNPAWPLAQPQYPSVFCKVPQITSPTSVILYCLPRHLSPRHVGSVTSHCHVFCDVTTWGPDVTPAITSCHTTDQYMTETDWAIPWRTACIHDTCIAPDRPSASYYRDIHSGKVLLLLVIILKGIISIWVLTQVHVIKFPDKWMCQLFFFT